MIKPKTEVTSIPVLYKNSTYYVYDWQVGASDDTSGKLHNSTLDYKSVY